MKQLSIFLLIASFALIFLCNAQDGPFEIPRPEIPPIKIQTVPPIINNPSVLFLISPLPGRCNPCKYGQPLKISCGDGT